MGREGGPPPHQGGEISGLVLLLRSSEGSRTSWEESSLNLPLGRPERPQLFSSSPPIELSALMQMFCICSVQNREHGNVASLRN